MKIKKISEINTLDLANFCSVNLGGNVYNWSKRLNLWKNIDGGCLVFVSDSEIVAFIGLLSLPNSLFKTTTSIVNKSKGKHGLIFLKHLIDTCKAADIANTANIQSSKLLSKFFKYKHTRFIKIPFEVTPYPINYYKDCNPFFNNKYIVSKKFNNIYVFSKGKVLNELIAVFSDKKRVFIFPFFNFKLIFSRYMKSKGLVLKNNGLIFTNNKRYHCGEELF